jgi:hypothetical protein
VAVRATTLGLGVLAVLFGATQAAADPPVVTYGSSAADTTSVAVLSGLPGYKNSFWWDHTNLTVSVRASNSVDTDKLNALYAAITVWHHKLESEFDGAISLTEVTKGPKSAQPDIILRYVPHAGGTQWGGVADCGVQKCLNVIVGSESPNGHADEPDFGDFDALRVERTAIHELGHALGLGHAAPLETSTDLMGYGWAIPDPDLIPVLSDCDIAGIRAAFGWYFANEPPHPATVSSVTCS